MDLGDGVGADGVVDFFDIDEIADGGIDFAAAGDDEFVVGTEAGHRRVSGVSVWAAVGLDSGCECKPDGASQKNHVWYGRKGPWLGLYH